MKTPNWLHCFSKIDQLASDKATIGMLCLSSKRIDRAANLNVLLEPEDVYEFTFEENLHFALNELGMLGRYCDSYFNVNKKDLFYAALKYDYTVMLLIDSKDKENKIKKIAIELFEQWYDLVYPVSDSEYKRLSIKYTKRKEKLKEKLLKYNVLK